MSMTGRAQIRSMMFFRAVVFNGAVFVATVAGALGNAGFEVPDQGSAGFQYAPDGASWAFTPGKSGLAGPDSPWKCGNLSPDPQGDQFAYLQGASMITQNLIDLVVGGVYDLSFFESYRTGKQPGNDLRVILDEGLLTQVVIYTNPSVTNTTWALRQSAQFVAVKSSYTLTFRSTFPTGTGDCTTIIDGVTLTQVGQIPLFYVPISNDANCDISPFKNYTHTLDFGKAPPGALINKVQFEAYTKADNGTLNFIQTFSGGNIGDHAGQTLINVSGSLRDLMMDLSYNENVPAGGISTSTLSALTPGVTYDLRLYVRQWSSNTNRLATLVFDPDGAGPISDTTAQISQDDATTVGMATAGTAYYLNYRFTAVAGEPLIITATQHNANQAWHFYGLTCEQVETTLKAVVPADNATGIMPFADLVATYTESVQKGSGNITLKRSQDDSVVEIFDVNSAAVTVSGTQVTIKRTAILEIATEYYVEIDAGAFKDLAGRNCVALLGKTAWNFTTVTERIAFVKITGDADCGVLASKTYTHKLDFGTGTPGALINGVQFDAYNKATNSFFNFSCGVSSGTGDDHGGNTPSGVSGALVTLLSDMYYNNGNASGGTTTWTLSGLTPGMNYDTRIYVRQWGAVDPRVATLTFDPDGAGPLSDSVGPINEDNATTVGMAVANDAYYISYRFTAVAGANLVITVKQHNPNNSWHLYGITNELIPAKGTLILIH